MIMACDSDDNGADDIDVPDWGTAEIELTGDFDGAESLEYTYFNVFSEGGAEMFMMGASTFNPESAETDDVSFSLGMTRIGMVAATTYGIVDGTDDEAAETGLLEGNVLVNMNQSVQGSDQPINRIGISTGGSITFDTVTDDIVTGTFVIELEVVDLSAGTEGEATMSGSFEAPQRNMEFIPGM